MIHCEATVIVPARVLARRIPRHRVNLTVGFPGPHGPDASSPLGWAQVRSVTLSGGGRILRLGIPGIKCVDTKYINNVNFNVVYMIV